MTMEISTSKPQPKENAEVRFLACPFYLGYGGRRFGLAVGMCKRTSEKSFDVFVFIGSSAIRIFDRYSKGL